MTERKERAFIQPRMAIERTILANERTFLSYSRTGIALFLAGVSLIHFSKSIIIGVIGGLCIPVSIFLLIYGTYRFKRVQQRIRRERTRMEDWFTERKSGGR